MPEHRTKEVIRAAYEKLEQSIDGFIRRPAQSQMIAAVSETVSPETEQGKRIAVIEGQTGTGKSIGYMLGAIPTAMEQEKTVVIATATVALQEQLVDKDLPLVAEKAGLRFTYEIAKGRGRYACPRNISQLTGSNTDQQDLELGAQHEATAAWPRPPRDGELDHLVRMEKAIAHQQWDGDLDKWAESIDASFRGLVTTTAGGCTNRNCPKLRSCPFFNARARLSETNVIIANHDLVLSDLAMGGGVILPKPEETVYIFDEGHHLPAKAVEHLSGETRIQGSIRSVDSLRKAAVGAGAVVGPKQQKHIETITTTASELKSRLTEAERTIARSMPELDAKQKGRSEQNIWRFEHGKTPSEFREMGHAIAVDAARIVHAADRISEELKKVMEGETQLTANAISKTLQEISSANERVSEMCDVWNSWCDPDSDGRIPIARWVVEKEGEITVAVSRITAADRLKTNLWDKAFAAIVTSATITALNSFQRFRRSAGLRTDDGTSYVELKSPFDYQNNGCLVVPWMETDPKSQGHTDEVVEFIENRVDPHQGTLVLFASNWQMQQTAKGLSKATRQRCLIQNEHSREKILSEHRRQIDNGEGSIIFGMASFAEGVDLPGDLCQHVVITKLPFAVPDSPVEATRSEWLENNGYNAFMEMTVPEASLKLIQAVGRLIRSETDTGTISILDRRVLTKRYGKQLLDALPPFRRDYENAPQTRKSA